MDGGRRPPPNAPADAASPCSTRSMGATKRLLRRRRRCAAWSLSCSWRPTRLASTAGHPPPALCSERSESADQTRSREAPCRSVSIIGQTHPTGAIPLYPPLVGEPRPVFVSRCPPLPARGRLGLLYRARMVPTRDEGDAVERPRRTRRRASRPRNRGMQTRAAAAGRARHRRGHRRPCSRPTGQATPRGAPQGGFPVCRHPDARQPWTGWGSPWPALFAGGELHRP